MSYKKRIVIDKIFRILALGCVIAAVIPLGSIIVEIVKNGIGAISIEFLTQAPGAVGEGTGGIGPAIQGTLLLIGLSSAIGLPAGIGAGIYMAEFSNKLSKAMKLFTDVLAEFPSIIIGILAFTVIVLWIGNFSLIAGAFALSIIIIPIVAKSTEESLKLVPRTVKEAALALGVPYWKTILLIIVATAKQGIITGSVLSISRIGGETAPLILTILGSSIFFAGLDQPIDALPLRIWRLSLLPYDYARLQGWGAALVLLAIVLSLNVIIRLMTRKRVPYAR